MRMLTLFYHSIKDKRRGTMTADMGRELEGMVDWQDRRHRKCLGWASHGAALCWLPGDRKVTATEECDLAWKHEWASSGAVPPSCQPVNTLWAPVQQLPLLAGFVWRLDDNWPQMLQGNDSWGLQRIFRVDSEGCNYGFKKTRNEFFRISTE